MLVILMLLRLCYSTRSLFKANDEEEERGHRSGMRRSWEVAWLSWSSVWAQVGCVTLCVWRGGSLKEGHSSIINGKYDNWQYENTETSHFSMCRGRKGRTGEPCCRESSREAAALSVESLSVAAILCFFPALPNMELQSWEVQNRLRELSKAKKQRFERWIRFKFILKTIQTFQNFILLRLLLLTHFLFTNAENLCCSHNSYILHISLARAVSESSALLSAVLMYSICRLLHWINQARPEPLVCQASLFSPSFFSLVGYEKQKVEEAA